MASLIPLSDLMRDRNHDFKNDNVYDPTGDPAYGQDGDKIGTVRGAMVDPDSGKLRYLIVDVSEWFVGKEVLVPVSMTRIEDDAVYFDSLTKDQVRDMREYRAGEDYDDTSQSSDERVPRGGSYGGERPSMPRLEDEHVTIAQVERTAVDVSGNAAVARRWLGSPNGLLGGRTPKEATEQGDGSLALGLLLNLAGT